MFISVIRRLLVSGLHATTSWLCCAARSAAGQQEHGEGHEHRPQPASQGHAGLPPTHAAAAVCKIKSAAVTIIFPWSSSHLCILLLLQVGEQGWGQPHHQSACRWRRACTASRWQASCPFPRQGTSPPCSGAAPSSCRRCAALVVLWASCGCLPHTGQMMWAPALAAQLQGAGCEL